MTLSEGFLTKFRGFGKAKYAKSADFSLKFPKKRDFCLPERALMWTLAAWKIPCANCRPG
jgi:hypothetical protein